MIRIFTKRSLSADYYVRDAALELDGVREGPAGYFLRGSGDLTSSDLLRDLWRTSPRASVVGYDIVIAAPRPLSILLAIGSLDEQRRLVADHRQSVASAMAYLETRGIVVRTALEGETLDQRGRWGSVIGFTHGVNRQGEPHLHDHVLVPALTEHRRAVLDSRSLEAHAEAADALYRAEMRSRLAEGGVREAWRNFRGIEVVEGVDEGARAVWPGERTRGAEKRYWSRQEILEKWHRDAQGIASIYEHARPRHDRRCINEQIFGQHILSRVSIGRRHVVEAFANAATFGARAADIDHLVNALYPEHRMEFGIREATLSRPMALQLDLVRERGPRPVAFLELERWTQRERSREVDRSR